MEKEEKEKVRTGIKQLGIIAFIVYKIFYCLKFLPPQLLFYEERTKHQELLSKLSGDKEKEKEKENEIFKRILRIELVIISYAAVYIFSITFNQYIYKHSWLDYLIIAIVSLRLIDIVQVNINITIFDLIKTAQFGDEIFSSVRTITLVCYNYIEVAVIFGIYYSLMPYEIVKSAYHVKLDLFDKFYFSFATQLTIGYGDIIPSGLGRALVCFQGVTGYFFSVLLITRILSSLPAKHSIIN